MQRLRLALAGATLVLAALAAGWQSGTAHADEVTFFVSPSGNIACVIDPSYIRCDISETDWEQPPRPADCDYSYGHMVGISPWDNPDGPAKFLCAGDSAHGGDEPLAFGDSITAGPMRCDSAESGITCRNAETGHGFSISRQAYELF